MQVVIFYMQVECVSSILYVSNVVKFIKIIKYM